MKTKGIRISDDINNIISVDLKDILDEIPNGELFFWSMLYFYGDGTLKNGKPIMVFEEEVNKSEKGLLLSWKELNESVKQFSDIWDISIVGCKDEEMISRYKIDKEMYETCDIVIEMIDSGYWEVFSKDINLIDKLAKKFKDIKFLESDFEK
jgi:hypothetical protein